MAAEAEVVQVHRRLDGVEDRIVQLRLTAYVKVRHLGWILQVEAAVEVVGMVCL